MLAPVAGNSMRLALILASRERWVEALNNAPDGGEHAALRLLQVIGQRVASA